MMTKPTIGLAMLCKNEEQALPATLERILPVIDSWTVIDTGSTDNTREIIRDTLAHLPGRLLEHDFDGFGPSRTRLLAAAKNQADYTLMLDADHTLHIDRPKPKLTADSYLLRIRDHWGGRLPLLTRSQHPFEYRGRAHSYLASDKPTTTQQTDWLSVDGGPGATRDKLERDLPLLQADFIDNPNDARTVFYLAQTHRDLDQSEQAIRFYRLRAEMNGFAEERYFARYQLGVLLGEHISFWEAAPELLKAAQERPTRVEALRALANLANSIADKTPYPKDDNLFVIESAYRKAA